MEVTKKIRFITPAILTLLVILSLTGSAMADTSKTYTLDDDFDEGTFVGVEHSTVKDQLQLTKEATTFPFMWIANAGEDTISKWDTNTNKELARYNTWFGSPASHDAWSGPSPSRTCVDVEGNCYVANRHFDYRPADVIKILLDDYVDRNGNGKLDTSTDSDNSGVITPDEMLPMTDTNNNGKIDDSEIKDERIAWAVSVGPENGLGRALAIDTEGNVWLGLYNEQAYYKLSSVDGSVLEGPISVSPNTPYGAAIDKHGILWGSSLSYNLLKLDTKTKDVSVYDHSNYGYDYGIALGYDDNNNTHVYQAGAGGNTYIEFSSVTETFSTPAQIQYPCYGIATDSKGNILASNINTGEVTKFAPDGSVIWSAGAQVNSEARGTVVDSNDDVWVIHREASKLSKFSGSDGAPLGVFNTGLYPYTYSDATGLSLRNSVGAFGTWTVDFDSEEANMPWGTVFWNASEPAGTSVTVEVRSSNDGNTWSSWETAVNGTPLSSTVDGRYLQIRTTLEIDSGDISPVLYDLSVEAEKPANLPPEANAGDDQTIEQENSTGASVTLDGSKSTDDGPIEQLTYAWAWNDGSAEGVNPAVVLPQGTTTVTLTVSDGELSDTDTVNITVQDTTEPEITVSGKPVVLWPPNHKYQTVSISDLGISVADTCDPDVNVSDIVITSVSSDEPEDAPGKGDGDTVKDIVIKGSQTVDLRAERQGDGNGRVYTINFEIADKYGNVAEGACLVLVPHDQGKEAEVVDDGADAGYTVPSQ
jgi:hypothetical protein